MVHDVLAVTEPDRSATCAPSRPRSRTRQAAQRLVRELTEAQARAAALKERSARWQQTLNDGVADLNADIDYDLRDRMREISRLAEEEMVGGGDPAKVWDQFAGWVQQQVAAAAVGQLHLGDPAGPLAGPRRSPSTSPTTASSCCPALRNDPSDALRSVRRDGRPGREASGAGQRRR